MNTNTMLKAILEIIKIYPHENVNEDTYRREIKETIKRIYDTNDIESEILMYLAEGDWYIYPLDCRDYILNWYEKENKIKVRVSNQWKTRYWLILEFDANYNIRDILRDLEEYDKSEMKTI